MNEIKQNSPYAWFLATRPKTLTGAIIPVLLGSALAFSDGQLKTAPACLRPLCLRHADCRQLYQRPLRLPERDRPSGRPAGPPRACAEGWITPAAMKTGIGIALTLSCLAGLAVLFTVWGQLPHGGWELVVLGVGVHTVCFPLYHAALLSGLGRRTGAGVLRLRARMRHLLRAGLYAEYGCGGAVARRGGVRHRHLADGEQLSRPRAGCRERQVYAGGALRQRSSVRICIWHWASPPCCFASGLSTRAS